MKKAKIQSVIVGVDFSKYSKIVELQARALADLLRVPLVFVYVSQELGTSSWASGKKRKHLVNLYTTKIKMKYSITESETLLIKNGRAYSELISVSKDYPSPLIVVGFRGDHGAASRFFLGSTAERLALHSPFPVWIQRGQTVCLPKNILIPTDFSARSRNTIEGAKKLGVNSMAITLHHVFQPPMVPLTAKDAAMLTQEIRASNARELDRFRRKYASFSVAETRSSNIVGEINKVSKSFDAIAISPRDHGGLAPSFGSVTSKLVRSTEKALLVIP